MNSLLLAHESLEFSTIPSNDFNIHFDDFVRFLKYSSSSNDTLYALKDLYSYNYTFGNFFLDLVYKEWDLISVPNITQITHQLLFNLTNQHPKLFKHIVDNETEINNGNNFGYFGINHPNVFKTPYITNLVKYKNWIIEWFRDHNDKIDWSRGNNILSDVSRVREIIVHEIMIHGLHCPKSENLIHFFHKEIMRQKGTDLEAYCQEIGEKILLDNFYIFEKNLSRYEQRKFKSLRKIYSIEREGIRQYISLDFKHGMFEFFDNNGNHLGEYRFDGSNNSPSVKNRNISTDKR